MTPISNPQKNRMDSPLYRNEVIARSGDRSFGTVSVATPISLRAWVYASGLCALAIVLWLFLGHYTRREHVEGKLVPHSGLISVAASAQGVVTSIDVNEGDEVRAGQKLAAMSGDKASSALGNTSEALSEQLGRQEAQIRDEIDADRALSTQQSKGLHAQISLLRDQIGQIDKQLDLIATQQQKNTALLVRIRPLVKQGFVSELQIQEQESQVSDLSVQARGLARQKAESEGQLRTAEDELSQLPLTTDTKINELQRQLAQGRQAQIQNELDRSTVLTAPADGVISSLLMVQGQDVSPGQTLLSIVPKNSPLEAQLLVPSTAIGFVRPGTLVNLHYQAFPYQKFGTQTGHVVQISKSALTPAEVTSLLGEQRQDGELRYRVRVALDTQRISAYGHDERLLAGMGLEADMMLERRSFLEWIFEPLYGMRNDMDSHIVH